MKTAVAIALAAVLGACAPLPGPPPPPPPPPLPRPQPSSYHALGTEPFWNLQIGQDDITFTEPEKPAITQPTPKVIVGFAGEVYQTPRINVNIVHAQCSDGMSDRVYPDKVQVTVDHRRFNGCGGL